MSFSRSAASSSGVGDISMIPDGGACEGLHRGDVALEEAPAGLLIECERAADIVLDTGQGTGVEIRLLEGGIIEAGAVGVHLQRHAAVRRKGPREAKNNQKCHDKWHYNSMQLMHFPQSLWPLRRKSHPMFAAFVGKPRGAVRNSHPPLTTAQPDASLRAADERRMTEAGLSAGTPEVRAADLPVQS